MKQRGLERMGLGQSGGREKRRGENQSRRGENERKRGGKPQQTPRPGVNAISAHRADQSLLHAPLRLQK